MDEARKQAVLRWMQKAENDLRTCQTMGSVEPPVPDTACFHAQQCLEKYLKAILEKHGMVVRKIHSLPILLDQCVKVYPLLTGMRPDMVCLSEYAVEFRYPGESAALRDAREAISILQRSRLNLRIALGLEASGTLLKSSRLGKKSR